MMVGAPLMPVYYLQRHASRSTGVTPPTWPHWAFLPARSRVWDGPTAARRTEPLPAGWTLSLETCADRFLGPARHPDGSFDRRSGRSTGKESMIFKRHGNEPHPDAERHSRRCRRRSSTPAASSIPGAVRIGKNRSCCCGCRPADGVPSWCRPAATVAKFKVAPSPSNCPAWTAFREDATRRRLSRSTTSTIPASPRWTTSCWWSPPSTPTRAAGWRSGEPAGTPQAGFAGLDKLELVGIDRQRGHPQRRAVSRPDRRPLPHAGTAQRPPPERRSGHRTAASSCPPPRICVTGEAVGPVIAGRPHFWDELIGSGPPPVKTARRLAAPLPRRGHPLPGRQHLPGRRRAAGPGRSDARCWPGPATTSSSRGKPGK